MTSELEAAFRLRLRLNEGAIRPPEQEYRFHPQRRWRFDFAWPEERVAVEIEGGAWVNGRHTRGSGFGEDCRKYNEAVVLGWRVLRVTGEHIENGSAMNWLMRMLGGGEGDEAPF